MIDDAELLRRYAEDRSEAAFAEFVGRHIGLVYSAAFRRTGNSSHRAAEIAQQVFLAAARRCGCRQAAKLRRRLSRKFCLFGFSTGGCHRANHAG